VERKTVIVSAISLRSGGTFSILQDCLHQLDDSRYQKLKVYAIVKDKKLFDQTFQRINFIEIDGTAFYLKRLYYEYFYFKKLSRKLKPHLWLSLHDITPNVVAERRVVYCHNASPFYNLTFKEFKIEPKLGVFKLIYKYAYKFNIEKNDYVIVQQDWLRNTFQKCFDIPVKKIIVAHPHLHFPLISTTPSPDKDKTFIYPTLPRVFKNIELICGASEILVNKGISNFKVAITIDGTENRYAKQIVKQFGHIPNLHFIGLQKRDRIFALYGETDCLLFPSKLESWGLPISEFKLTKKPILLSDMPYAHEALGDYDWAGFFNPFSKEDLAEKMKHLIQGTIKFEKHLRPVVSSPMSNNWHELFETILK